MNNNNYTNVGHDSPKPRTATTGGAVPNSVETAYAATPTFTQEARPPYAGNNTYGTMPKYGQNGHNAPTTPTPGPADNYYIDTPEFVPEPVANGNGQYAAVNNQGLAEYAEVVDESEYYETEDNTAEYSVPDLPASISTPTPTATNDDKKEPHDFDSSSYREINYSELVLEEEIGRGAFGSVYRVSDTSCVQAGA